MTTTKNPSADDESKAQRAINIGSGLSVLNSLIHLVIMVLLLAGIQQITTYNATMSLMPVFIVLLSWAVTYALLSLVVTNAITAKYTINQNNKAQ